MTTAALRASEVLEGAVRAVGELATGSGLDGAERRDLVATVDAAVARLTAARSALLVAERDSGAWRGSGDRSFEAWRARTSRAGMGPAVAETRRGDVLVALPGLREAVEAGRLTVEHVDVVARTAAGASAPVQAALASPAGQAELLGLAARLDAGRFRKAAATWAAGLDLAALERTHQAQRAARFLHLADTAAGTRISGQLDAVAGHTLRLALEAAAGKPAADDARTPEQRRADALVSLASVALSLAGSDGVPVGPRAQVAFVMREETWAGLRAARSGAAADTRTPTAPATLADGDALPPSEVARLLCDCELTRVVLDAAGQPLDLGRAARLFTPAQRTAVMVRDGGCFWPGCGAPTRWCEVHHLVWWDRDRGTTSVEDGALACSYHHHEIHRLDLTITRSKLPDAACPAGATRVAYTVVTPGGRLLADGRPLDDDGRRVGVAVRTWTPGRGASDSGPPGREPPPPRGTPPPGAPPSGATRRPAAPRHHAQPLLL